MAALYLFFAHFALCFSPLLFSMLSNLWTCITASTCYVQRSMHKIDVTLPAASRHQSSNCPGLEAAAEQQPKATIQQAVDKQETQTDVSPAPAVGGLSRRLRYMYLHLPFLVVEKYIIM
jgi:hypothetical protein